MMVTHSLGGPSVLDHVHPESVNLKNLGEMMATHYLGGWVGDQSSFTRCMLNLNFKILSEMMVTHTWGIHHP